MIKVKSSKSNQGPVTEAERFAFVAVEKKSRLPVVIGGAIMAIAAYFRTSTAATAEPTGTEAQPHALQHGPAHMSGAQTTDATLPADTADAQDTTQERPQDKQASQVSATPHFTSGAAIVIPFTAARVSAGAGSMQSEISASAFFDNQLADVYTSRGNAFQLASEPEFQVGQIVHSGGSTGSGPIPIDHPPVVSGPVRLSDTFGANAVFLTLASLLLHASDADGDALQIGNLRVSSGRIVQTEDGALYLPDPNAEGPVEVTYEITDGKSVITQTANFTAHLSASAAQTPVGTSGGQSAPLEGASGQTQVAGIDVTGTGSGELLQGGEGNDTIHGGEGSDVIYGFGGDDALYGDGGQDQLFGGEGQDLLYGGDGHDILMGDAGSDQLFGGGGSDALYGGDGEDVLEGGDGDDLLVGGAGQDTLIDSVGSDTYVGGAGSDRFVASLDRTDDVIAGDDLPGAGSDPTQFAGDRDTLDYSAARQSITINLALGTASGIEIGNDSISGFEIVLSGDGDDHLIGGVGNDELHDGAGADQVDAGDGDDLIVAALDATGDTYNGGEGHDTVDYSGATLGLTVNLATGLVVGVEIGEDHFSNIEEVHGGHGDDDFELANGDFFVTGGQGDDTYHFDWSALKSETDGLVQSTLHISDFARGDKIKSGVFDLFEDLQENNGLSLGSAEGFDGISLQKVGWHLDHIDDRDVTVIKFYYDNAEGEVAITLDGQHFLTFHS